MNELNVQQLLINFGAWVRDDKNDLGYGNPFNAILAAAPHLDDTDEGCEQDVQFKNAGHMTDLDAAIIDTALIRLYQRDMHLYAMLRQRYIKGWAEYKISKKLAMSREKVGKDICRAEGVLEGLLMRL
ncbi:hypothetical protein PSYG_00035 [Psychrobacter phage pOW20-A]|uniref:anti-termination protein Q-like n=1 Tax=Psychrobacter phage pOW20-A TaxID=754048 RepID=UPI0002C18A9C|nr:anti-termination protein Q-like [Psychrobacter phage pOW20-A]AGH57496.1 hypothetical protein PSYG_00035 [Psychrobacter phage pOW20-A]